MPICFRLFNLLPIALRVAFVGWLGLWSAALLASPAGNIVSIQGKGEVRPTGANDWQLARTQQEVFQGDYVRTGDLSQMAILIQRDKTQIRLNQNSVLQIKTAEDSQRDTQTMVRLNSGRAWSAAKTGPTSGATPTASSEPPRVRMETPSATLAIRGTDWEVEVGPDGRTQLAVMSGLVEMFNDQGTVRVAKGEAAVAEIGKAPVKIVLINPRERVQWVTRWKLDPARYFAEEGDAFAPFVQALARGDISRAAKAQPAPVKHELAVAMRAALLIAEDKLAEARVLLDPVVGRNDAPVAALLMAADLLVFEGRRAEAVVLIKRAQAVSAGSVANAQLARLLLLDDKADEALQALQGRLGDTPSAVEGWLARGEVARFQGDAKATFDAFGRAARLAPLDDRGFGGLGSAAVEREEVSAARDWLDKAIGLNPEEASHLGEKGMLEALADNYDAAQAAFDAALKLRPDDYVALVGRGVMKLKQARMDEAIADFFAATMIEPRYARAHLYTGIAHYQSGNAGRAVESFNLAAELDPKDPLPPLYASMIHTDRFELAEAMAAARAAQARMPFLKSLNQVANNQKGAANVGNALAFGGMRDWALAYAHDGYYPYWAGSHLFLADMYDGKYAKNSELFQGYQVDPTVFGAANRQQTLIHRPGHYQTASLTVGRDSQVFEWVPRVTLNGYANSVVPFAYFVDVDQQNGRSHDGQDFDYRDRTLSTTLAFGVMPRHDFRLFFYHDRDKTSARYNSVKTPDLDFRSPVSNTSIGGTWLPHPNEMLQLRLAQTSIDGSQTWRNAARTTDARFSDDEVTSEVQLAWRKRIDDRWEFATGIEGANNPESSGLAAKVTASGVVYYDDDSKISERSRIAYLSVKRLFSPTAYFQLDFFGTRYDKVVSHDKLSGGARTFEARNFDVNRVSPRVGLTFSPYDGHRVRMAYQDWVKPSSSASLGPVDTAGIVLDESALRFGGHLQRLAGKIESEWSHRLFTEFGIDHRRVENLAQWDFSLADNFANLSRLRQRNVSDIAAFYAGPSNNEYSSLYLNSKSSITQARFAMNGMVTSTLSATAAYVNTHSKVEIQTEDWYYLPRHQTNFGLTWVSPMHWRFSGEAQWRSTAWTFSEYAQARKPYWNANFSAYWETPDKRTGIALFAKDLLSPHDSVFYGVAASLKF